MIASGPLSDEHVVALHAHYEELDPLGLQRELMDAIDALWALEAVDPASERMQRLQDAIEA